MARCSCPSGHPAPVAGFPFRSDPAVPTAVAATTLRRALARFVTGVTVVTAADAAGRPTALTVNAFTSVSLEPPLVLVCIDERSRAVGAIRSRGRFAVHLLAAGQGDLARRFARTGEDKLALLAEAPSALGNPLLRSWLALFECRLDAEHAGGDHRILVGEVLRLECRDEATPALTFFQGELGATPARCA